MNVSRRRVLAGVSLIALFPENLRSQQSPQAPWPDRTVKLIVPVPAGGSPDIVARLLAEKLSARWKSPVIVENRPGGDGAIAVRAVSASEDNHTLLLAPSGMLTITPALRQGSFNLDDIAPLSKSASDYLTLAVPAASPHRTVDGLVKSANSMANAVNWFAPAGLPAVVFRQLIAKTGMQAVFVPYKGGPDALRDLAENRIQAMIVPLAVAQPMAAAHKVRLIAVTNGQRFPDLPDVPTMAEAGFADLEFEGILGLAGPKSLPPNLRAKIASDVEAVVLDSDTQQKLLKMGMKATTGAQDTYKQFLERQQSVWGPIAQSQMKSQSQ